MAAMEHVGVVESHVAQLRMRLAEMRTQLASATAVAATAAASTDTPNMVDSGTSSAAEKFKNLTISHPLEVVATSPAPSLERATSQESGVMEASSYANESLTKYTLKWQPLRGATRCSNIACRGEFASTIDRRIHCHRCGLIFCRLCVKVTADERERVCDKCRD